MLDDRSRGIRAFYANVRPQHFPHLRRRPASPTCSEKTLFEVVVRPRLDLVAPSCLTTDLFRNKPGEQQWTHAAMLWAVNTAPEPVYRDVESLPTILAQRRITNIRKKQLIKAAMRPYDDPPPPPKPDECCGSSCDPCVKTLWKEELACWRERWGPGAQEATSKPAQKKEAKALGGETTSMPGSFDW